MPALLAGVDDPFRTTNVDVKMIDPPPCFSISGI
jgi:hypothetical protein